MQKKYRLISAALLLFILTGICSCAQTDKVDAEAITPMNEADQSENIDTALETMPSTDELDEKLDFGGQKIRFILADSSAITLSERSIYIDELTGEAVDDAVFNRNLEIQQLLNVEISLEKAQTGSENFNTMVEKFVSAGLNDYEVVAGYQAYAVATAATGMLKDLAKSDYIDFDREYWATDLIKNMGYKNRLFWGTGDITLKYIGGISVSYVNKRLFGEYHPDVNLCDLVRAGGWTVDKLSELCEGAYKDLNGNNRCEFKDQYGFGISNEDPIDAMVVGTGLKYTEYDKDGVPVLSFNDEKLYDIYNKLGTFLNDETRAWIVGVGDDSKSLMNMFAAGQFMFIVNKLYNAEYYLRDMEDDYLVLPLPKYDENQKDYLTSTHDGVTVFGIPVTCEESSAAEATLEAMSSLSNKLVRPVYINMALKSKYARDAETAEMIDIAIATVTSDFALQYHRSVDMISHLYRKEISADSEKFASSLEALKKNSVMLINKLTDSFEANT